VPRELVERPKQGFAVPVSHWLRGPLRDWAEALLSKERLEREGYLAAPIIRAVWHDHVTGKADFSFQLWSVLMFQAWLEERHHQPCRLGTAIEQTEHIVVDDGSTDLMELPEGPARLTSVRPRAERGANLATSSGEFICFLDSDDRWFPDKLREQVALFHAHPEVGVVYGDYVFVDERGNELAMQNMARYSGRVTAELLADNFISMNTTMTRAAVIRDAGGFAPDDRLSEDYGTACLTGRFAPGDYNS
jgi:hypothetical protein